MTKDGVSHMGYWSKFRRFASETMEMVAIGRALERREITPAQASAAINRIGRRDDVDVTAAESDRSSDRELAPLS